MEFLPKLSSQECWCFPYSVTFPAVAFHRVLSSFFISRMYREAQSRKYCDYVLQLGRASQALWNTLEALARTALTGS